MHEKLLAKMKKAGLSEIEARVYISVLSSGGAYPSKIAETTGVNRSTVYKTLTALDIRGLVSNIEKGKKLYYQAEKPDRLLRAVGYQRQVAEDAYAKAKEIMPELEELFGGPSNKPRVTFYEGYDRVVDAYITHVEVEKGYEMRCFASAIDLRAFLSYEKFRSYIEAKERIGIPVRFIAPAGEYTAQFAKDMFTGIKKSIWPQLRTVPKSLFTFPAEITLYDSNKVSIVKFDKEHPVAVIIVDQTIYDMMGMLFELVWKSATPLTKKK